MNDQPDSWSEGSSYLRYDRSERLKRAPESVQQMYEPDYIKKSACLKVLPRHVHLDPCYSLLLPCLLLRFSLFY